MRADSFFIFACFAILFIIRCNCLPKSSIILFDQQLQASTILPDSGDGKFVIESITTPNRFFYFTYDKMGRLIKEVSGPSHPNGIVYSYDSNGKILYEAHYRWANKESKWEFEYFVSKSYDKNGNVLESMTEHNESPGPSETKNRTWGYYDTTGQRLEHKMSNMTVYTASKMIFTYDTKGEILSQLYKRWGNWDLPSRNEYYNYDNRGNRVINSNKYLDEGAWSNTDRTTYTHDKKGRISCSTKEMWWKNKWIKEERSTYTDENRNKLTRLDQKWENNRWINDQKVTSTYDSTVYLHTEVLEKWENNRWVNWQRISISFNMKRQILQFLNEEWEKDRWVNSKKVSNRYNVNGYLISTSIQTWDGGKLVDPTVYSFNLDQYGNTMSGEVKEGGSFSGKPYPLGIFYDFNRKYYDLTYSDKFEVKYRFLPTK